MARNRFRSIFSYLAALATVIVLFGAVKSPELTSEDPATLAAGFSFQRNLLTTTSPSAPLKFVRQVHPSLKRIAGWISTVGAAVALGDIDGNGLPDDVCSVDPRTDQVLISPAPTTASRFKPFALRPDPSLYDPKTMAPMGCLIGDLNEDGLADLVVYYWGRTPLAFLRAPGTSLAEASYIAQDLAPSGGRWFSNAGFLADLDGDGHLDLVIGNYFQDGAHILDAAGAGTEQMHSTKSRSFNGGGKHFLLFQSATTGASPSVRFEDANSSLSEEVLHGWVLAAGAADLDGDLLPEIYFAHDFGPDRLLHNESTPGHLRFRLLEGKRTFLTPSSCVLGKDSFKGMGVDFADMNGDGIPDIYVSNIADEYALQESHFLWLSNGEKSLMAKGIAPYVESSEKMGLSRSGWGWDLRLADFNNDGKFEAIQATGFLKGRVNRWPELQALGTGNDSLMHDPRYWPRFNPGDDVSGDDKAAFFVQASRGRFQNVASLVGIEDGMVSRAIATADVDGDGRLDFAFGNQWSDSYFFRNRSKSAGAFLGLRLLIPPSGTSTKFTVMEGRPGTALGYPALGYPAIGAAAVVHTGERKMLSQIDGGSGHSGKKSPELHFGLGPLNSDSTLHVDLTWRDANGHPQSRSVQLKPGWHTVVLGS